MKKIVFLDVDGTLINYEAKLPESAKKAVEQARQNGHMVYICTGCSKAEILQRGLMELDGMILGNGTYAEHQGQVIFEHGLTKQQCQQIVDWCNQRHLGFYLESNSGMYYNAYFKQQAPQAMIQYALGKGADLSKAEYSAHRFIESMIETDDLYRYDVNKISFILSSYQDHLDSRKDFPELEANTWGGKGEHALFGDLGPANITKKHAVELVLDHLGKSKQDAIAFGDAKIDLSMFEACSFTVAMGNGGKEIKEAADYITDDVDHDGLMKAFQHLGLME